MISWNKYKTERNYFDKCYKSSVEIKDFNALIKKNNKKATLNFGPRLLIFKLQQEVLKFNDICVSWSYPNTDLEMNFLNLENRKYLTFSQQ